MRGFFALELLLVALLLPYWLYLFDVSPPPVLREVEVYAQDAAQLAMYGYRPNGTLAVWVDGVPSRACAYRFRYCTWRYFEGGEHQICAAECLP